MPDYPTAHELRALAADDHQLVAADDWLCVLRRRRGGGGGKLFCTSMRRSRCGARLVTLRRRGWLWQAGTDGVVAEQCGGAAVGGAGGGRPLRRRNGATGRQRGGQEREGERMTEREREGE